MINRLYYIKPLAKWARINLQAYTRTFIIFGVLALSFILAYFGTQRQFTLLLLLFVGAGTTLLFLRWPGIGLIALIVSSLIVPFALGTGTQTSISLGIVILVLLTGLWIVDGIVNKRRDLFTPSRPLLPLLALAVVAILSFVNGQLPWFLYAQSAPLRAQLGGLAVFLLSICAFLIAAHQIKELRWLKLLTWMFLMIGAFHAFGRVAPFNLGVSTLFTRGATGSLFWVWLIALTGSQAILNQRLGTKQRLILFVILIIALYSALIKDYDWKSGWVPSLIALFVIVGVRSPLFGLFTILAGGLISVINLSLVSDVFTAHESYSILTRFEAWRIVAEIVKVNPILGLGPANYYWYTPLFPILGWSVQFNSHNNYVDIVAQIGLLGLLCFLWFAIEIGYLGWRLANKAPVGFAKAYAVGAIGGLIGTLAAGMLGDWFLPFVYNVGLSGFRASMLGWVFLGGLVSLERILNAGENQLD